MRRPAPSVPRAIAPRDTPRALRTPAAPKVYDPPSPQQSKLIAHLTGKCGLPDKRATKWVMRGKPSTARRGLTRPELTLFERAASRLPDWRDRLALLLLPWTGLRVAEICHLSWDGIEWGTRGCSITLIGKGLKVRKVSCGHRVVELLQEARKQSGHSEFVFPTDHGGPLAQTRLQAACRELQKKVPELRAAGLTPHVLRHTYASLRVLWCQDLKQIKQNLGHGSLGTTITYLHANPRKGSRR